MEKQAIVLEGDIDDKTKDCFYAEISDTDNDLIILKNYDSYRKRTITQTYITKEQLFKLTHLIMLNHKVIEWYKGYSILQYVSENGYRVDFGTKRSKLVETIEEARKLIDY